MIKKLCFFLLFITGTFIASFQLQAAEYIWREAEDSAEYFPVAVKSDLGASDYIYIGVLGDSSSTGSPPANGNMVWTFQTAQSGQYNLWCRVKVPWNGADSYWVKMDSGIFAKWENFAQSPTTWEWCKVTTSFNLSTGNHTLTMAYSANQACLDKILITNDTAFTPAGLGTAAPKPAGSNNFHTNSVVDVHKNLKVTGRQLQDYNGNPVQLRGLVTHGLQWYSVIPGLTIPNLAQEYGIDIIRIAMYVEDFKNGDFWGGYLARPAEIKKKAKDLIDDAISAGIYVIISWHIHNNPVNFTTQASDFFREISQQYGGYANILYEICNEPEYTAWDQVKTYANTIIPIIRSNDSDNIIIVGTPNWCQDLMAAANSPLTGYTNILYSFHFYAASHEGLRPGAQQAIDMGLPVIVTEWGTTDYTGGWNGDADLNKSQDWIDWMNSNNISWTNWSLGNKNENSCFFKTTTSLAGPWSSSELTPSGNFIAQKLMEGRSSLPPTPPPTITPTNSVTTPPTPTPYAPGVFVESGGRVVFEAENYAQRIFRNNISWESSNSLAGFSGSGYMTTSTNNNVYYNTGYSQNSPEILYGIRFYTTGTYYVWVRANGPDADGDSVHIGLDSTEISTADRIQLSVNNWEWRKGTMDGNDAQINVGSAGIHNLNLWMREDGARIDKIILTTDSGYTPDGTGPAESARDGGATSPPTPSPTVTPTATPAATPTVTPPTPSATPSTAMCSPSNTITLPGIREGTGEFCFDCTTLGNNFINSWNLDCLIINGIDYTNRWVSCATIPKINNKYIIQYRSNVSYGHFESQ